jgi:hypothetical protein
MTEPKPRRLMPPPDLQALVIKHGSYDKITPEAWAEFDAAMAEWKERVRLGMAVIDESGEPPPLTNDQIEAIEAIVDHVITGCQGPTPEIPLSVARSAVVSLLRVYKLPVPDDGWLNDVIRDWAAFNEREIDEAA